MVCGFIVCWLLNQFLYILGNYRQLTRNTTQKTVLAAYLLLSFVELVVSIMANYNSKQATDPDCNFMLMGKANAYLVVKAWALFFVTIFKFWIMSSILAPNS